MATITWPPNLPQRPRPNGYKESFKDNTIRKRMDTGPDKSRRRSTADTRIYDLAFDMTLAETEILDTFYKTSAVSGTLLYDWFNPRTSNAAEFRFMSAPTYSNQGGDNWTATFKAEELPQ